MFTVTATFTQLVLNPRHRDVADDLANCDRMHQRTTGLCCPGEFGPGSRQAAGVLYRVEQGRAGTVVLVQSLTDPDFTRLPPGYAVNSTRDLSALLDNLERGTLVRYRIAANPTRREPSADTGRGKVRGLRGNGALTWWQRRADEYGLDIESATISREEILKGVRQRGSQPLTMAHVLVQFDGTAVVRDPGAAREAILAGIGRAKSYGCGLLSVAPIKNRLTGG